MSDNRQWDSIQLQSLDLPYNTVLRELDPTPRQVSGSLNTYITHGGKIMKRPGTISITNTNLSSARFDRLWTYETLDTPVVVYLMASVWNGVNWALYYNRLDGSSPGWTSAGSLRQLNASTRPHEATVSRGLFYVKGYPSAASGETLGTVLFNGSGGTPYTTFWGLVGPTTPARISGGVPRLNPSISATATTFTLSAQTNYNLLNWSQDLTQSSWAFNTASITSTGQPAPDGTNTADILTSSGTNGFVHQDLTTVTGTSYTFSVWLKNNTNQPCNLLIQDGGGTNLVVTNNFTVTSTWTRFAAATTAISTTTKFFVGGAATLGTGATMQIWGAQVEITSSSSAPQVINVSPDFSQAAWGKTNITVATGQSDPLGPNTAYNLTQTSTNSDVFQQVTTVPGQFYLFSVWLKSAAGAISVPIQFAAISSTTCAVTTSWQQFTLIAQASSTSVTIEIGTSSWGTGTSVIQAWAPQVQLVTGSPYERTLGPFNLPAAPFNIQIDYELITVTAWTPGTGTVTTALRGAQGTVPAAHAAGAAVVYKDWANSPHAITVNNFWAYSYAYQTRSGHISNRSPLETNPDNNPSLTGPIINLIPKLNLQGHPDIVNVTNLIIFRSTDGGGTYFQVATVANTGAYPISWQDTYQASTGGATDPTPDSALNLQLISPTLTSNSPPPTVITNGTTLSTVVGFVGNVLVVNSVYNGVQITPPPTPFTVTVDNEQMTVTAYSTVTNSTAIVNRGVNGTVVQSHATGAQITITPVVGIDPPIASTPTASYASRLWIGIGNILLYSAQEELNLGVPEEAWPAGTFGNFYRLQFPIVNIIDTTNALYVITTEMIYQLTGSNLETFYLQPILHNIGGAIGHPQAVTKYRESIVWLTSDLRIAILQGGTFRVLSEPLGTDYVNLINTQGAAMILKYWAALDKEWIVLSATVPANHNSSLTWVYDIEKSEKTNQDFWSTPWTIQAAAIASGRVRETEQARRLAFAVWDGANTIVTRITDNPLEYVGYDVFPSVAQQTYDFKFRTNLWMIPPGDHVNLLRRPGLIPIVYGLILEETTFSTPSTDPQVFYYTNDLWTTPKAAATAEYSVHDDPPIGYRTRIFPLQEKARRFAFEVDKLQTTELFEIQDFSIVYNGDNGSGI